MCGYAYTSTCAHTRVCVRACQGGRKQPETHRKTNRQTHRHTQNAFEHVTLIKLGAMVQAYKLSAARAVCSRDWESRRCLTHAYSSHLAALIILRAVTWAHKLLCGSPPVGQTPQVCAFSLECECCQRCRLMRGVCMCVYACVCVGWDRGREGGGQRESKSVSDSERESERKRDR